MAEYKEKIPAAGGKVEFLYDPVKGIAFQISGFGLMYFVAVSMDGKVLLSHVPAVGVGQTAVYPKPSVLTAIQSDAQGMWGRNCPFCKRYFRTTHIQGPACCPYCAREASSLGFVSEDQRKYITACYDAFARAYLTKKSTSVETAKITDDGSAWHYSEEKQQYHFSCETDGCGTATDILGEYGYCPRCGFSNARKLFREQAGAMLARIDEIKSTVPDQKQRQAVWEELTKSVLSAFEPIAKHLRVRLLCIPSTRNRKKKVNEINFQGPIDADQALRNLFDIGLFDRAGNAQKSARTMPQSEVAFIKKMVQRRHILMHNGGIVDQAYLEFSGDDSVRLGERIRVKSSEVRHFIECIRTMTENLLDNVEYGFEEE